MMPPNTLASVSAKSHRALVLLALLLLGVGAASCTAHYPVNKSIVSIQTVEGYSMEQRASERSGDLLLVLTFSGGGTRAAAFSYGVLKALADTNVVIHGRMRRLLDEVDGISSVSGGSFTAAYFGLFGDRIFEDFETKFLKHDVQSDLTWQLLSPLNWPKLSSLYYDRSELCADYYDEILFEKKTFQDIVNRRGPVIVINATDMALGSQFSFARFQFAPICTDLLAFPVSRAVTASSAVPGAFSSVVLKNHAGDCDYTIPKWATEALQRRQVTTRRYNLAKRIQTYQNVHAYPYIHLLDGGISDNLGIRLFIDLTMSQGDIWKSLKELDLQRTRRLAIIVVNAQKQQDVSFAKRDFSIPMIDTIGAASSVPLDQYSYETMELLRRNMDLWRASITEGRCRKMKENGEEIKDPVTGKSTCAASTFLIEVNFDALEDEAERTHLKSLPTSFALDPKDVDRLVAAAKEILLHSEEFQALRKELQ